VLFLYKKIKFDLAYLAEYSPRPGTAAAKLKDNVSAAEKTRRRVALNEILKKTALENNKKMVGKNIEVLVEKINNNYYFGKTKNFKDIKIVCHSRESGNPEKRFLDPVSRHGMTNDEILPPPTVVVGRQDDIPV
jgi:tRNA A37 methylthiotransferase MiaB